MEMEMNKYAELILKKGIQIQVNEPLLIVSSVEKIEFVRILTQTAYNMGIKKIDYLLEDDILKYKAYQNLSEDWNTPSGSRLPGLLLKAARLSLVPSLW